MMNETRQFHLGDILSITTGRLVSPNRIKGVRNIVNYMCRDSFSTYQLSRASKECEPYLLEAFPHFADIDIRFVNVDNWEDWLGELVILCGEFHAVRPIHQEDHEVIDPLEELASMVDESKIMVVDVAEEPDIPDVGDISWKVDND